MPLRHFTIFSPISLETCKDATGSLKQCKTQIEVLPQQSSYFGKRSLADLFHADERQQTLRPRPSNTLSPAEEVAVRLVALLSLTFVLLASNVVAQSAGAATPQQQPVPQNRSEDGGVTETLQSIFIPPKLNAPFSLTLHTEWVKTLADGSTVTLVSQRRISRDSQGRISQERAFLVPKNGNIESRAYLLQIADPHKHAVFNCFKDSRHECQQLKYDGDTSAEYNAARVPSGELPNGTGRAEHEDLGAQLIEAVETVGTRDRVTYNPWVFGNDQVITVEREYWYSPQLGINLLSSVSDPRIGKQSFRASEIVTAEPDPSLFRLPPGFKVVAPAHSIQSGQSETAEQ
jgi:hypothetical protein